MSEHTRSLHAKAELLPVETVDLFGARVAALSRVQPKCLLWAKNNVQEKKGNQGL